MDLAAVAVVGFFVGLAGREVERAGDFFVEENVPHRLRARSGLKPSENSPM